MNQAPVRVRAPLPDFRFVELSPYRRQATSILGATASSLAAVVCSVPVLGGMHAATLGAALFAGMVGVSVFGRKVDVLSHAAAPTGMTIVPWGLLLSESESLRSLRWSGIEAVTFQNTYGPRAYGVVKVVTRSGAALCGRIFGEASLERLEAYFADYRDEQNASVALDLEGIASLPSSESCAEMLLLQVEANASTLGGSAYRESSEGETVPLVERLRVILKGMALEGVDRRPFAALLAARMGFSQLTPVLLDLVQSPHPLLAASAKRAAQVLGAAEAKTGSLDELASFLDEAELAHLQAWRSVSC
jgi:hypothetical protein